MGDTNTKVKFYSGSRDFVSIDGEYLHIGCICLKLTKWIKEYKKIGKEFGYTEEQIKEYGKIIRFFEKTYF